jgi:hypothetical protein
MTYTIVQVGITESQLHDLMQGVKIHLARDHFSGSVSVPLTKAQATSVATATRGINLKMSGPQQKWLKEHHMHSNISDDESEHKGEGFLSDVLKAAAPLARKGVDYGLDHLQGMIPTDRLGSAKDIGDAAVNLGRKGGDKLLDMLQKKLGGSVGRKAIDKHMGRGWFDEYLLPAIKTAASIALPIIRGGGTQKHYKAAMDKHMGSGWFDEYLLPGLKTAADIAIPLLKGGGFIPQQKNYISAAGWFDEYLLPGLKTAADIAIPLIKGRGLKERKAAGFMDVMREIFVTPQLAHPRG